MRIQVKLFYLILLILVVSCDKNRVFDEYKSVGNSWHKDSIVNFKLPKLKAEKQYNLFVNIRDNADYQYDNIFLIVSLYLGKDIALQMIGHPDPNIQTQALQCISKIMVSNWEFMK